MNIAEQTAIGSKNSLPLSVSGMIRLPPFSIVRRIVIPVKFIPGFSWLTACFQCQSASEAHRSDFQLGCRASFRYGRIGLHDWWKQ